MPRVFREAELIAANISDSQTWNRADTLDRLGGDEVLLLELIGIFPEESPKLVQELRDAICTSDAGNNYAEEATASKGS